MAKRIAFFGSPAFAVPSLQALAQAADVALVVTQPDRRSGRGLRLEPTAVRQAATDLGLPIRTYDPKRRAEIESDLGRASLDALVVVAFGHILRETTWSLARCGAINVHASLLPRWRGVAPIERCLLAGDRESGVSLMRIDAGVDTGPVWARRVVSLAENETRRTLTDKLSQEGARLLLQHLEAILQGKLLPQVQDESQVTYAAKLSKAEGELDWRQDAVQVERQVRALQGWPGTYTQLGRKTLKVHGLRLDSHEAGGPPGTLVEADPHRVCVACGRGRVQLLDVQLSGKPRMAATALVLGRQLQRGQRLGPLGPETGDLLP